MRVIKKTGNSSLASVYVAESESGKLIEFVESTQPPFTREEKWVLVISTLYGCPVDCKFCDAGGKKITLNFAVSTVSIIDPLKSKGYDVILRHILTKYLQEVSM